jgi:hypothetical protein
MERMSSATKVSGTLRGKVVGVTDRGVLFPSSKRTTDHLGNENVVLGFQYGKNQNEKEPNDQKSSQAAGHI